MQRVRVDSLELNSSHVAGGLGARLDAPGLARRADHDVASLAEQAPSRRWMRRGARLVRDAVAVVTLMMVVPMALVAVRGDALARMLDSGRGMTGRIELAEQLRPYALASDPAITPMQAGLALNALLRPSAAATGFTRIEPTTRPAASWRSMTLAPEMFATARPDLFAAPSSRGVLQATAHGLTSQEREYLRALATAPVWRAFDLVARAPAVDVVGGQFRIPFGEGATAEQRPLPKYGDARELAYAAVSRAAYHMSVGQRDSAEIVLRSIVSFGFALIDNGPGLIDEMIGTVIVGTGRDALQRYYVIQHDGRASLPALQAPSREMIARADSRSGRPSADEVRERMLIRLADPRVPRGERLRMTRALSLGSCTSVRDLLLGPRAEVIDAIARARLALPRYASERAFLDLQTRPLGTAKIVETSGPFQTLAVSAASVPGMVFGNPRLEACTLLLTGR